MKCVVLLMALTAIVVAESFYYTTENDYLDTDAVFSDPPVFQSYIDCFLDRKPCTSLAASYKKNTQEAVIRACDRCNFAQRVLGAKFLLALKTLLPHDYINIRQKYDPAGIYFDRFEAVLSNYLLLNTPITLPYYFYLYKK